MKKYMLVLVLAVLPVLSFAQLPKLKATPNGFAPVVYNVDSLSDQQIYSRLNEWVQRVYKNPKLVLKASIENKMIRIRGEAPESGGWVVTYQVDIKDKKYKLTISETDFMEVIHDKLLEDGFNEFAKVLYMFITGKSTEFDW